MRCFDRELKILWKDNPLVPLNDMKLVLQMADSQDISPIFSCSKGFITRLPQPLRVRSPSIDAVSHLSTRLFLPTDISKEYSSAH